MYGTYGDNISFLYNGQYGVTTDGNGLYYMRARYYNVDIKRFVNQDVLTGTLERISSLNWYAYVEGNPVSFLDPFGLEKSYWEQMHEDLQIISTVLMVTQTLVACVMIANPTLFVIGGMIEDVITKVSIIATCLDTIALLGIAGEQEKAIDKWLYIGKAFGGVFKTIFDNSAAKWFAGIDDSSSLYSAVSQIVPALQQCFDNITEGFDQWIKELLE